MSFERNLVTLTSRETFGWEIEEISILGDGIGDALFS